MSDEVRRYLGERTIEGFGVMVDDIGHRLVVSSMIVA
jgi:hypothetical protein